MAWYKSLSSGLLQAGELDELRLGETYLSDILIVVTSSTAIEALREGQSWGSLKAIDEKKEL